MGGLERWRLEDGGCWADTPREVVMVCGQAASVLVGEMVRLAKQARRPVEGATSSSSGRFLQATGQTDLNREF